MIRWFYISIGCLIVAMVIFGETVSRTGMTPAEAAGVPVPELALPTGGPSVLVFLVGNPASVSAVRSAIAHERVVTDLSIGFAVKEGRIVATNSDAAGRILTAAGWGDRHIEIVRPAPQLPDWGSSGKRTGSDVASLAQKATLTQAEAMAVINSLN